MTTEVAARFDLVLLKGPWSAALDEMKVSLTIGTPKGIVLLVGCSHTTLEKIFAETQSVVGKPIRLIFGGTHLLPIQPTQPSEISQLAEPLREDRKKTRIVPPHSASQPAFAVLEKNSGDRCLHAGLGAALRLGSEIKVHAKVDQWPKHAIEIYG